VPSLVLVTSAGVVTPLVPPRVIALTGIGLADDTGEETPAVPTSSFMYWTESPAVGAVPVPIRSTATASPAGGVARAAVWRVVDIYPPLGNVS
jgi:hypothetical protein